MKNERKITTWTKIAYGSGRLVGSGFSGLTGSWLLFFYTTFCGLSATKAALIFSIATAVQAIFNPIMAFITDNFYATKLGRKFGRRRFWILISIPLMMLFPFLWIAGMNFWYYLFSYVAFEIIYTMSTLPYGTLAVEMTTEFDQRAYLEGYGSMIAKVANFMVAALPGLFFMLLGKNSPYSFLAVTTVYGVIMVLSEILVYKNTWERSFEEVADEHVEGFLLAIKKLVVDILSTLRIRAFRQHLGIYMFGQGAEGLFSATFTYFIVFALARPTTLVSGLNSMSSIIQLCSTAVFMVYVAKKGFRQPLTLALSVVICSCIAYAAIYFFHLSNITWVIIAVTVVFATFTGGVFYVPVTLYTFMADVDEAVTNRRREGTYSAVMGMAGKLMNAVYIFMLGFVLDSFGFKEGATVQSTSAVHAIIGILVLGVGSMAIVGILSVSRLKLNHHTHQILVDEVARIHDGGSMADVTDEAREVVETLTGFKYEDCFGNNNVGYHAVKVSAHV
ncbi:MFS transporter [Latilactobacillus sakei]|uniref:MFS transporter n=1 Tax=Latilactobacillus sakei TaxID=1599 RepID=UPI000DC641E0|nr:MFS transporter [Latilactobacillus sakei]SPS04036.1 Melibiose carrier protein [Latilactobacillus sakei]